MPNKRPDVKIMCYVVSGKPTEYFWTLIYGENEKGYKLSRVDGYRFDTLEKAAADFFVVRNLMNKISCVNNTPVAIIPFVLK